MTADAHVQPSPSIMGQTANDKAVQMTPQGLKPRVVQRLMGYQH